MPAAADITLQLAPDVAEDFRAVAKAQGVTPATLAASIVGEWVGPTRVANVAERAVAAHRLALLQGSAPSNVSPRTLKRWKSLYRIHGLAGLVDHRQRPRRSDRFAEFKAEVVRLYRAGRHPIISAVYREAVATAQQRGWRIPSYKAAQRAIAARRQYSPAREERPGKRF